MNSPLNNELLVADTGLENSVENSAMAADSDSIPRGNPYHKYTVGEDGNWYNDNDERVYYWVRPFEGDEDYMNGETQGIGSDLGGYYTEEEIRAAYIDGSVLAQETGGWDNYWAFIQERQQEIQSGNLVDPIQANYDQAARDYASENTDPDADIANTGRDEEIYYAQSDANKQRSLQDQMTGWVEQNTALMNKYGISGVYSNDNGDYYAFNGSTYSRVYLAPGKDWGEIVAGVMLGAFTGNLVGGLVNAAGGAIYGAGWGGPIVDIINGVATGTGAGAGYEIPDMNPNVIVNIAGVDTSTTQTPTPPADETPPTGPEDYLGMLRDLYPDLFKGADGIGGDGSPDEYYPGTEFPQDKWDLYGYQNLPEGYVLSEDGKYVTGPDGERYPVYYGMYGARVFLPKNINEEGGGGSTDGGDSGGTTGGDAGGEKTDSDGDGIPDDEDEFPADPNNGDNGGDAGDDVSQQFYEIDENGDVYIIVPDGEGGWNDDGTWNGEWRKIGNTGDEFGDVTPPWWSGAGAGSYGEHGETVISDSDLPPGGINPDGGWGDTGTGGNGDADVSDQPDGTPCSIGGKNGVVVNGVCVIANIPNPNPNPNPNPDPDTPAEGDACTTADGAAGTIKDGVCVVSSTGGTGVGVNVGGEQDGDPVLPGNNGDGDGDGDGNGSGDGDGDGDGSGSGSGNGNGMLSGSTGSTTQWGPLFPAYQFKKFQYTPPPQPTIGARLFDELFRK